jgi:hypothetical protein
LIIPVKESELEIEIFDLGEVGKLFVDSLDVDDEV